MSKTTQTTFPTVKLRWALAQLETQKEEPPTWLLRLAIRDDDTTEEQFERVSDFRNTEINPEISAVKQQPVSTHNPHRSSRVTLPISQSLSLLLPITCPLEVNRPLLIARSLALMLLVRLLKIRQPVPTFRASTTLETKMHATWLVTFACQKLKAALSHQAKAPLQLHMNEPPTLLRRGP